MKKNVLNCIMLVMFVFCALGAQLLGEDPAMVADIAPGNMGSVPEHYYVFQGKLYFAANDGWWGPGAHGTELWVYDGTNPPEMVADINPHLDDFGGIGSSYPRDFVEFNGKLYFSASDGDCPDCHGTELWVYDGENPPALVADIQPGNYGSYVADLVVFKNKLYFKANDGIHGDELWVYDGINPAHLAAEIVPGANGSYLRQLTEFDNNLYFNANDHINGAELWVYDGVNPPQLAADIASGSSSGYPYYLTVYDGKLCFTAYNSGYGYELWEYDGINPPTMVDDICPGNKSSNIGKLIVYKSKLYFSARESWTLNVGHGNELWVYDGVNAPYMVADIYPGYRNSHPMDFCVYRNKLYFDATDGVHGKEVWEFDGVNPPGMLADSWPGSMGSNPRSMTVFDGKMYFSAGDAVHGTELWVYDSTRFTVTTGEISGITATSASGEGEVAAAPGVDILSRGLCWSTLPNPDITNDKTVEGSGSGIFFSTMTGLMPATTYYVRAYASDAYETVYGEEAVFTTKSAINLLAPLSGDMWEMGRLYPINWGVMGPMDDDVQIQLLKGGTPVMVISASTPNNGSYAWGIPGSLSPGADYSIRITTLDLEVSDDSEHFSIILPSEPVLTITNPLEGAVWQKGSTYTITWVSAGKQKPKVKIKLERNGRVVMKPDNSTPNDGSFTWTVPMSLEPANDYVIRITTQNNKVTDVSAFIAIEN